MTRHHASSPSVPSHSTPVARVSASRPGRLQDQSRTVESRYAPDCEVEHDAVESRPRSDGVHLRGRGQSPRGRLRGRRRRRRRGSERVRSCDSASTDTAANDKPISVEAAAEQYMTMVAAPNSALDKLNTRRSRPSRPHRAAPSPRMRGRRSRPPWCRRSWRSRRPVETGPPRSVRA